MTEQEAVALIEQIKQEEGDRVQQRSPTAPALARHTQHSF